MLKLLSALKGCNQVLHQQIYDMVLIFSAIWTLKSLDGFMGSPPPFTKVQTVGHEKAARKD